MKISIAMATCNGAGYLQEQLDSFLAQTRRPDELVVSDDASTDATLDILSRFRENAPFDVRIIRNSSNLGYAGNFSRALCETAGDLVFLSDQDDVWFPDKLETVEAAATDSNSLVLMNDAVLTDQDLNEAGVTKLGQIRSAGLSDSRFVMGSCAAIRRGFLDLVLPIPPDYPAHDGWIIRIAEGVGGRSLVEKPLQYYRRHGNNESPFIANRTAPVTRLDLLKHRVATVREKKSQPVDVLNEQTEVQVDKILLSGVERAMQRSEGPDAEGFRRYADALKQKIEFGQMREQVRKRNRLFRVPGVMILYARGGYTHFRGYMSAFRDIVFK